MKSRVLTFLVLTSFMLQVHLRRPFSSTVATTHQNALGLPRKPKSPPQIPRKTGPVEKRRIPNVNKVIAVASGKGGVGKSTVAVNLALALALSRERPSMRVGLLDLDIFGPSIPLLMGLEHSEEPQLTAAGAIRPLVNHGIPTMSMGFLLPKSSDPMQVNDQPVVWRGLMVQKAVQQLLFDVDWSAAQGGSGLDILVVDMPPGTGDVPLTLGQLVKVDGMFDHCSVIVSTPQDVALSDVRKGISMFKKISVPITGIALNQSHFTCGECSTKHELFGSPKHFESTATRLGIQVLGELPLVPGVSSSGDVGRPYMLKMPTNITQPEDVKAGHHGGREWKDGMANIASRVLHSVGFL